MAEHHIKGRVRFGLGKNADLAIENLGMLVHAGIPIGTAITTVAKDIPSKRVQKLLTQVAQSIDEGTPLWQAMDDARLASSSTLTLIKNGEDSGMLSENLQLIAKQQQKNRVFQAHLRSAMIYPTLVLVLAVVIGSAIAWFILPNLASIFKGLNVALPLPTQVLIDAGQYIKNHGPQLLLVFVAIVFASILLWSAVPFVRRLVRGLFKHVPGVGRLMREVEIARMGYIAGSLLEAGLPVTETLVSLQESTQDPAFERMYQYLKEGIEQGESFQVLFSESKAVKRALPAQIRSLVVAGEESGALAESFLQIADTYDEKIETTSKNLSVILEPVLLVVVWLVVVALALSIILPIYSLISNLNEV